jgi:hypothetical protein
VCPFRPFVEIHGTRSYRYSSVAEVAGRNTGTVSLASSDSPFE